MMEILDIYIIYIVKLLVIAFLFLLIAIVVDHGVAKLLRLLGCWPLFLELLKQRKKKADADAEKDKETNV